MLDDDNYEYLRWCKDEYSFDCQFLRTATPAEAAAWIVNHKQADFALSYFTEHRCPDDINALESIVDTLKWGDCDET